MLIARGLAEESGKRIRLSTKAIVGATSKGLVGADRRHVRGGPAAGRGGDHDRRQRHHQAERHRPVGAPAGRGGAAAAGQRRGRRRRHLPGLRRDHARFRSRCAGWRAAADCGWRARRPSAVRAAGGVPVPFSDLLAPEFLQGARTCCSPTTCSTRRRPDTRWRPSSCCPRCVMRWASSSTGTPTEQSPLESRTADAGSLLAPGRRHQPAVASLDWGPRADRACPSRARFS